MAKTPFADAGDRNTWGEHLAAQVENIEAASKAEQITREYRVKPVLRYIITEYVESENAGSSPRQLGEYDNRDLAWVVADGIAKANGGFAIIPNRDYRALAAKLQEEYGIVG